MGNVILSGLSEFIDELKCSRRYVDMRLVRIAEIENEVFLCSSVRRTHVIVTARIGQDVVRLDLFYGPSSGHDEQDREAKARDLAQLREACCECGLQIRRGVLQETVVMQ
jgi:hypothetical protein